MALRLYQITDTHTRKAVEGLYFSSKPLAKDKRNELNDGSPALRYVVSPGPDHRNYRG